MSWHKVTYFEGTRELEETSWYVYLLPWVNILANKMHRTDLEMSSLQDRRSEHGGL